ncbi:carbon-nitrogen hydrolase family protein [Pedobacter sp. L105]|uniref:carbon-nitrogen hydrolase family protein n=1 Tax=Pedobacter sp. L105 TaxID=1641871 RepID=UPI00131DA604|nr:carbon-nitrogen hydrolase family protein [Pedobacter sp. L105]
MIIAAAQTIPKQENIKDHCRWIELAAAHQVQLLIFPELSLTGYQREKAEELSFVPDDPRLKPLQELAIKHEMIVIAGAPIQLPSGLHIGSFILFPDRSILLYTKQFLHDGEELYFVPGNLHNPQLKLEGESFSLAICADLENPAHPENASKTKSTAYLTSIFYTPNGIAGGLSKLQNYAAKYSFNVLMANYGGDSYGMQSGGQSSFWTNAGEQKATLNFSGEGLIIAEKNNTEWTARIVTA